MFGRIKNNWRTGTGKPVTNKPLWQKLTKVMKLHARMEWSWVKAHSGILLNECADMLATMDVENVKPPQDAQQYVGEAGEDTDAEEYVRLDGEERSSVDWNEDHLPERTLIWRNSSEFSIFPPVSTPMSFAMFGQEVAQTPVWPNIAPVNEQDADSGPDSATA
jgi:hypothetical protein